MFLDEIIIGGVRIIEREKLCELKQLFILPEFQNKGYAKQAIYQVESLYSQKIWELDTIKQEEKLCHLYEAVGYKLTGKEEHIKPGMTLVFYRKTLPACQTP
ncbi:GNAT family N-acetyltransferase [Tyzzerella sp. OttesenSCG-928-J15]|nr:GNAT family N-acetyltransferase [Tyzzerella sp. OttesenSCG-928-J15]